MSNARLLFAIVRTDYMASLAALAPVITWGMALILPRLGMADAASLTWVAGVVTLVALPVLVWRVAVISNTLANGLDVPGVVTNRGFFRGRGWVTYVYTYLGDKREGYNAVQQNKRTNALQIGDEATVALDPNQPKRAFIRRLYES